MATSAKESKGTPGVQPATTDTEPLAARQLARAYVPFQRYTRRFEPEEGLSKGTIFPELYFPYRPAEK
ncbi:MAG: spore coat associated protein CotJA [Clostridia bacterium]|nr:spore coat associated protein CotJA [Clostridia bacterium]